MTTPNNPTPNSGDQWGSQPPNQPGQSPWGQTAPNHNPQQPWGSPPSQPQWAQSAGNQPPPQPPNQPGQQQWGQPSGPQQPQQPQQPWSQPAGAQQPQQTQQPQPPQQPWGAQPGQLQGQGSGGGAKMPSTMPAWPTWAMLGFFLLSFLTSFLAIAKVHIEYEGFTGVSSLGASINWWGSFKTEASGLGGFTEAELENAMSGGFLIGFGTVVILGCYIAATVLYFLGKDRLGAVMGIVASGIQMAILLVWLVRVAVEPMVSFGAGWWLWLLIAIIALALSIFLLVNGRDGVEDQFTKAKTTVQQVQQRAAEQREAKQAQQAQQQFQQPGQQGQQPQPQQPPQPSQQGFQPQQPPQPSQQGFQPQQPNQQAQQAQPQQPGQQPQQPPQQGQQPLQNNQQSGSTSYRVEPSSTSSTTDIPASTDTPSPNAGPATGSEEHPR
nr:Phosphoinositide polyphosphatase (Sac family) [Streptococcus thermophilus]